MSDVRTVDLREEVEPDEAPLIPIDESEDFFGDAEVMGGVVVTETDPEKGGVWELTLEAGFATQALTVTEVDERLEEGTYVLLKSGGT